MTPETVEGLVRDYGYIVILVGTYFDHYGVPLFLVFGGIAASHHVLDVVAVGVCGFAGGWIADLFLYFLGYKTGLPYWMQFAAVRKLAQPIEWTRRLFQTRPAVLVILGRFMFAVSKIIPPFAGMIRFDVKRYVAYSFIGNAIFSTAYTVGAFLLGPVILDSLKSLKALNVAFAILFVLCLVWLGRRLIRNRTEV
jgi:membrane-associated protein